MEISEEERAALNLAADYASGNRPQTPWERLARRHKADTAALVATDDEDHVDGKGVSMVNDMAAPDPPPNGLGSASDAGMPDPVVVARVLARAPDRCVGSVIPKP